MIQNATNHAKEGFQMIRLADPWLVEFARRKFLETSLDELRSAMQK